MPPTCSLIRRVTRLSHTPTPSFKTPLGCCRSPVILSMGLGAAVTRGLRREGLVTLSMISLPFDHDRFCEGGRIRRDRMVDDRPMIELCKVRLSTARTFVRHGICSQLSMCLIQNENRQWPRLGFITDRRCYLLNKGSGGRCVGVP